MMEKIFITGTGRCGTTFLIKLFSFLEFNTGYTRENYKRHISNNCNSGMEQHNYKANVDVIKNPLIISQIDKIINDENVKIKVMIIPVRDYSQSANSRVSHQKKPGGLWNANDLQSQINFYHKIMAEYIYYMTKYDINTIFLDFDRMVNDKNYLYDKIKYLLDEKNISFEKFCEIYDFSSETSAPNNQ